MLSVAASTSSAAPPDLRTAAPVIRLSDNLDEAEGIGWCINTIGRGLSDRLHAHSCKHHVDDLQRPLAKSRRSPLGSHVVIHYSRLAMCSCIVQQEGAKCCVRCLMMMQALTPALALRSISRGALPHLKRRCRPIRFLIKNVASGTFVMGQDHVEARHVGTRQPA